MQLRVSRVQSNPDARNASSSIRSCDWHTADHQNKTCTIFRIFRQQPPETSMETSNLSNFNNDATTETIQSIHTAELKQWNDLKSQTLPLKRISLQRSRSHTQLLRKIETRSKPVPCLDNSRNSQTETQGTNNEQGAGCSRDGYHALLPIPAPQIEESKKSLWEVHTRLTLFFHRPPP